MAAPALDGIVVLDLGQIYNGPYATFLMAMAGARVIKVESLVGETLRGRGETSSAAYPFAMLNQNKESITVNLKTDKGKVLFRKLVEKADVLVENFSPNTMAGLELGAEALLEVNPRLIYASGSGYGRSGLHRDFLAMDITVQAMSGVMSTTGMEGMPPMKAGPAICDFFGGVHLYGAVITKLFERERTGKGAIIDVAMQDAVLPTLATLIGAYYYKGREVQPRTDNRHPALTMAPYNVYPAADGHVSIICVRDSHWRSLTRAMGRHDLLEREDLARMADRASKMEEVDALVSEWTAPRGKQELLHAMQAEGVPSAVVRNVEEVLADRHLHDRGMLHDIHHPVLGDIVLLDSPLNVAFGDAVEPRLPPALGEHNSRVYGELLGLDKAALDELAAQEVI
ncbi:MAG TPA: CoA transferase [Pseudomonadales bacterium]|nr:CoA transferase [Pseudomonadales bacterium]